MVVTASINKCVCVFLLLQGALLDFSVIEHGDLSQEEVFMRGGWLRADGEEKGRG